VLTDQDPIEAIKSTIPSVIASSTVSALLLAGVKQILDGARIDSDRSAPTQEQLHSTFLSLVEEQTEPLPLSSARRRILFFIDELDRCPQEQVVATLAAIRNYFEAPGWIFVVAADRQVLERAFAALPWPNPGDEQNPYYGSASEFFDKIFQYQIPLPPLRGDTLLKFANDLVVGKSSGIWADLRRQNEGHLLGAVLYALIPSHLRSPRRVKVLLNAFATNARIASSRGIDWLARAQEISKLTALQTEFPLFANDLIVEPRLPSYLLNPESAPEARSELIEKHRLKPEPVEGPAPEQEPIVPEPAPTRARIRRIVAPTEVVAPPPTVDASVLTATDPTPRATSAQADVLKIAQRLLLHAYLIRVQDVADPSRDLLYLSSAGEAFNLEDSELAAIIEERAVGDPAAVIEAAARNRIRPFAKGRSGSSPARSCRGLARSARTS
jgi:KAP family P-loop domain